MVVLDKENLRLPRVEKEKFITLLRLGLDYDRDRGIFRLNNCNQIEKLANLLAEILEADEVTFAQTCISCGASFSCKNCNYLESCVTKNLPFECVCPRCLKEDKNNREHL